MKFIRNITIKLRQRVRPYTHGATAGTLGPVVYFPDQLCLEAASLIDQLEFDLIESEAKLAARDAEVNRAHNAGFVEASRIHGVEIERLRALLKSACERMDRARGILTDYNPRPDCNWGMLETNDLIQVLFEKGGRLN